MGDVDEEIAGARGREEGEGEGWRMEAALDLMRRMPPRQAEAALSALLSLLPHHADNLLSQIDQPLQVR